MICFPNAKINLGLSVVSKRPDGFHNLETIFYPLLIRDVLELIPSQNTELITTGLAVPGDQNNNLVVKAYEKMKTLYPQTGALEIHLHKAIPMGAGLGGGSSDAAAMIIIINRLFKLHLSDDELMKRASELGSDCPFFMQNHPCFASGRGEMLESMDLDLSRYSFLFIHPEIKIETAWAFSNIEPKSPEYDLKKFILQPIETWRETIRNDFEIPVFREYPQLKKIKENLYSAGALYASMTGSGSTVFGIFRKNEIPKMMSDHTTQTQIL
jgi:4-diphosphocytidyl-2-C-methyl-D-erythritol kinase